MEKFIFYSESSSDDDFIFDENQCFSEDDEPTLRSRQ